MIRLIIRHDDGIHAAHTGASVYVTFSTYDIDAPDLERILRQGGRDENAFKTSQIVGAELLGDPT